MGLFAGVFRILLTVLLLLNGLSAGSHPAAANASSVSNAFGVDVHAADHAEGQHAVSDHSGGCCGWACHLFLGAQLVAAHPPRAGHLIPPLANHSIKGDKAGRLERPPDDLVDETKSFEAPITLQKGEVISEKDHE